MAPGKDMQVTHLQGMPDIVTALTQGRIDAGVISAPTTLKRAKPGFKELVDVTARNMPMIHAGLATTRDFIKNNPDKVRRYVRAYIEGLKMARTDAETTKQIIGKYTKTENKEDLDETYNTYVKAWEQVALRCQPRACRRCSIFASIPPARPPSRSNSSTTHSSPNWKNPVSSKTVQIVLSAAGAHIGNQIRGFWLHPETSDA